MAFSFILSTGRGFFRRKDLLFPDILASVVCLLVLCIGSRNIVLVGIALGVSWALGAVAYFLFTGQKSYGLYWVNQGLYFSLLVPQDQRYSLQIVFAVLIGFGLWWTAERNLRVRFPLALVQISVFLLLYLLPGISFWEESMGSRFRDPNFVDFYTSGIFANLPLSGVRFSALEAAGGYGVILLLPILLKRPLAFLLWIFFGALLCFWTVKSGIPASEFVSEPVWGTSVAFALALSLPGRNTESALPISFLALLPVAAGIFLLSPETVPAFTWVPSFFFIESVLIRIFLGDRIEKHEPADGFN
ncbi:hypothetical protein EHO61_00785 [Leptospira fluminis]|uniref:Uncharacterized protein n=1 Tax=Leptospira fluminis TaxID=2484979 RepID=A0A4V3JEZ6_9LEPT|nr:hypothetical protein EHO61_00785 [Leptospira fluminis]